MSLSTRVYIGRLSHSARESDVERFFKGYGKIREITLKEGYGFVEFGDKHDAEDAVYEMNGRELLGDRVIVEHAKPPGEGRRERGGFRGGGRGGYGGGYGGGGGYSGGFRRSGGGGGGGYGHDRYRNSGSRGAPPTRSDHRVLISNLSSRVSWQDLKDHMRSAGEVVYADAHKLRPNEGVVEFASASDMRNAIAKMDDTELNGRRIRVVEDGGRGDSRRGRSRSASRSYSRSRSRSRGNDRKSYSRSRSKSPGQP